MAPLAPREGVSLDFEEGWAVGPPGTTPTLVPFYHFERQLRTDNQVSCLKAQFGLEPRNFKVEGGSSPGGLSLLGQV